MKVGISSWGEREEAVEGTSEAGQISSEEQDYSTRYENASK